MCAPLLCRNASVSTVYLRKNGAFLLSPGNLFSTAQPAGLEYHSSDGKSRAFRTFLGDLATIVKNRIQPTGKHIAAFDMLTQPTGLQQRAFDLLGVTLRLN
jgi:hypothetical protein